MRSKRLFHRPRPIPVLLLVLSILGLVLVPSIPLAHAAGPFVNEVHFTACAGPTCTTSAIPVTTGNTLVFDCFIIGSTSACSVSDSLSNSWTQRLDANSNGNNRQTIFTTTSTSTGSDTFTTTSAGTIMMQIVQYTGITGIGNGVSDNTPNNPASYSNSLAITTSSAAVVYEGWDVRNGGGTSSCATLTPSTGGTIFSFPCFLDGSNNGLDAVSAQTNLPGPGTFQFTMAWTGATNGNNAQVHMVLELDIVGGAISSQTTLTQCYGNCGNPAVTLTNTNSTHSINFNQSITLFYEFQANLNGFLLNVTTSLAKSYGNVNGFAVGVYTIQSCPTGQTVFSPQCPGLLQIQNGPPQIFTTLPKGKISFFGLHVPVTNGQWVGIALTGVYSGLDLNDTNTNIPLFQTNEGRIPPTIQSPSALGNSKMGLWAYITGNVVTNIPPTSSPSGACGPGLDSILSCVVNSSCTVVSSQCQTGASIFWIIMLTIVSMAILLGILSYWLPTLNLSTKGMGEFAVLLFIGWFTAFAAFGLLLPYMMILLFFVVAWLFLGRSRGTGPI